jgi:hypothetical protein
LDDFAADSRRSLSAKPNERRRQGMRAAMKRNAPKFTSDQFSALPRDAHLATARRWKPSRLQPQVARHRRIDGWLFYTIFQS